MRRTLETNILIRACVDDDPGQAKLATDLLDRATLAVIHGIVESEAVLTDRPAVDAGLDMLRAGGDCADEAIAMMGQAAEGGQAADPATRLA